MDAGAELWRWLADGAHFYVCGDASRMAKDVDAVLTEIIREHGGHVRRGRARLQARARRREAVRAGCVLTLRGGPRAAHTVHGHTKSIRSATRTSCSMATVAIGFAEVIGLGCEIHPSANSSAATTVARAAGQGDGRTPAARHHRRPRNLVVVRIRHGRHRRSAHGHGDAAGCDEHPSLQLGTRQRTTNPVHGAAPDRKRRRSGYGRDSAAR